MAKHTDTRPAHHRIAARIRADIMSGDLTPGQQLPITQDLVTHYGVSGQTVQRALGLLKDEIERGMKLMGVTRVDQLTPERLRWRR